MSFIEHCARSDAAGHFHLKRQHLLALDFGRQGLASVNIDGGWYYVRRDGRLAPVMTMDNGAEPFAEGFARSPVGGKIGFINRNLALVIPARYDGALPFERCRSGGLHRLQAGLTRRTFLRMKAAAGPASISTAASGNRSVPTAAPATSVTRTGDLDDGGVEHAVIARSTGRRSIRSVLGHWPQTILRDAAATPLPRVMTE